MQSLEAGPEREESEGATRPPAQPEPTGDGKPKDDKDKEITFWYSTGDTRSTNTKDDIDMELISLGRFFGQVRGGAMFFLVFLF